MALITIPQHNTTPRDYGDIRVLITSVQGDIKHNSSFTDITCYELTDIIVSGELQVPDQDFRMPIAREDGKTTIFLVKVKDGRFDATLNFPTSGEYTYTNKQANYKFEEPIFVVDPISITVVRKVIS